jgi:hypothetical protein
MALDEWLGLLRGPLEHAVEWDEIVAGYLFWVLSIPAGDLVMSAIDAELKTLEERIGQRLIARYARD